MIELHDRAPVSDRRGLLTPSVDLSSDDDDDAAAQDDQHLAGPFRTIVNTFLAFFGAAILSTPYAFASGGLLLASATLAAVSAGCVYCMWLIVVCKRMLINKGAVTYSEICGQALGLPGLIIAEAALVITQVSMNHSFRFTGRMLFAICTSCRRLFYLASLISFRATTNRIVCKSFL
jgi:amino acid permease